MYRVIFMGTPEIAVEPLKAILDNHHFELVGVVTQPDRPYGRNRELKSPEVKKFLYDMAYDVPVLQPENVKDIEKDLKKLEADLIITCAYGQFLPKKILEVTEFPPINLHASLLPKYRGGAPINYVLMNGEKETGISIMRMIKKMDAGEVYDVLKCDIDPNETYGDLYEKVKNLAYKAIDKIPAIIENGFKGKKQVESKATFSPNITFDDKKVDFNKSAEKVHNKIRGLSPFPTAYAWLNEKNVKFYKSKLSKAKGKPGEVISIKNGIQIGCKTGSVIIEEMQLEGKRRQSAKDIANGKTVLVKDIFK